MMATEFFADRLATRVGALEAPCVVGLDPRLTQLPAFARRASNRGLDADAAAVLAWNEAVIEAVAPVVPMVKPQSAFYEVLGPDGIRVLRETIRSAKEAGLLVLLDAKRADIGSTAEAYARTSFSADLLNADALTVLHYFGREGLDPFLRYAQEEGRGLFVVVHSSNPSAGPLQEAELADERRYYELVAEAVVEWGSDCMGQCGYSSVGAVMGATYPEQLQAARKQFPSLPLLIPGYGAQGGTADDVRGALNTDTPGGAVVAASRSIYGLSETEVDLSRVDLVDLVRGRADAMVAELRRISGPVNH
jgi:orotidine-5'-phosphate decarboxylase